MSNKTNNVLNVLRIISWIALIGYAIEAGSMLISFAISLKNPEAASDLYKGLNLSGALDMRLWQYFSAFSLLVAVPILKAAVWYKIMQLLTKLDIIKPFHPSMPKKFENIAYDLFAISMLIFLSNSYNKYLNKFADSLLPTSHTVESYLFMAALVYVLSQIFKKGIELQSENELTV